MQTHQRIQNYIESLIHFTDDQADHQPHRYMLIGFLDAHRSIGAITDQQKQYYLDLMDQCFAQQEQQS